MRMKMSKLKQWLHYEDTVPTWERLVGFGNLFTWICLAVAVMHILFMLFGFRDFNAMGVAFFSAAMIQAGIWIGRKRDSIRITANIYSLFLLVFGYYGFVQGGGDGTGVYWCFLQPMMALYVLGLYFGSIYITLQLIIVAVYFYTPIYTYFWPYSQIEATFIPMAYTAVSVVSYFAQWHLWKAEMRQKKLAQEANDANEAKSDFLANMSHEIRTPMNGIMGMCEMTLNEDISDAARENISGALLAANNLMGIINDLLDFSKITSGKMDIVESPYETASMLNDVINLVESRKKNRNLAFMVDLDAHLPSRLIGDELRIRQILVNLLTNAVKYTREGGVLFTVTFREESYGINLHCSVRDSGIGIRKQDFHKIFTSFSQVDTRKNRTVEGTGLGLPIARKLAEAMGGFIRVESDYGEGSEFTLIIPQEVDDARPMAAIQPGKKKKVLYYLRLDYYDHPFQREGYEKVVSHAFEQLQASCEYCRTQEELEEKLQSGEDFDYLMTSKAGYLSCEEMINRAAKNMEVLVFQHRTSRLVLPDNIRTVYMPFHAAALINVLNTDHKPEMVMHKKGREKSFCAPSAKILIVDDNFINLKVAEGLLMPYGVMTDEAESGAEAIEILKKDRSFDLVFLDHMMPDMDGVETAAAIRAMEGEYYSELPVVALTANTVSGVKDMFLSSGFQDYLAKPIELNQLEQVLKRWLPEEKLEKNREITE